MAMKITDRLKTLEQLITIRVRGLPLLVAKDHDDAQRIAEAYHRAGWKGKLPTIIIMDIKEEKEHGNRTPTK
jgi:hypothetical protein